MPSSPTPLEQPCEVLTDKRKITIGLPSVASVAERRFPLTPEGAAMLCGRGFEVKMESGAAGSIHFDDESYRRGGVRIVDRSEAFACDIVIHLPAISAPDARQMKTGAVLMSLLHLGHQTPEALRCLLHRHVIAIALDLVTDAAGHQPFADILSEVDGRAAVAMASSLLADPLHGKGILLGGVAGIVPCEVTIIGSGIAARAAACSALGMGATVRMFDNDVYRLRDAIRELGDRSIIGSALHPRVFAGALRTADVVIATPTCRPVDVGADMVDGMKRGVIIFDLARSVAPCLFPGLKCVDLANACADDSSPRAQVRTCYVNAGSAVPRTAAMALSTTLLTLFEDIIVCDGLSNALKFNKGLSRAAYTFLGKPVNPGIAKIIGQRSIDITLFLQFS